MGSSLIIKQIDEILRRREQFRIVIEGVISCEDAVSNQTAVSVIHILSDFSFHGRTMYDRPWPLHKGSFR